MNSKNTDAAAKAAANIEEERMHPIFDECEVNDYGEAKRHYMLSMNGMYISGITDDQLKEMHEKLTELLTGEKPRKYFYAEASVPRKDGNVVYKKRFRSKDGWRQVPVGGCSFPSACILREFRTCRGCRLCECSHHSMLRD